MKFKYQRGLTLPEGATHVSMPDNKCKFAFTLAEVLVTLVIIGVVAVLTVPGMVSNHQKKLYVAQLQKGYNQLQELLNSVLVADNVEYLADTELMQSINGTHIGDSDDQSAFSSILGQYMKIQKVCQPHDFSKGCHDIIYSSMTDSYGSHGRGADLQVFTKDGMIYYFHNYFSKNPYVYDDDICKKIKQDGGTLCMSHTSYTGIQACLEIDVNGVKKPNKYGRDLFRFHVDDKGRLIPYGSPLAFGDDSNSDSSSLFSCNNSHSYGISCAAKIMADGWKMDY